MPTPPSFCRWYAAARARSGLTLRQLAPLIECDQGQISHIEHGRRLPSPAHLRRFLAIMQSKDALQSVNWDEERAVAWDLLSAADEERSREQVAA